MSHFPWNHPLPNWIGALSLSLLLELPPRKLEICSMNLLHCFVLWSFFLLRLIVSKWHILKLKKCLPMKEQWLLAWNNWYKNTVVCYKKHYLYYFQSSNFRFFIFSHAFLCKQRWQLYHGAPAYDYNSSKIRSNIPDLFPRQETLGTRLQHSILGNTLL